MAIPTRAIDGQKLPALYLVEWRRMGIQTHRPRRSGEAMGNPQKQAQDELRET